MGTEAERGPDIAPPAMHQPEGPPVRTLRRPRCLRVGSLELVLVVLRMGGRQRLPPGTRPRAGRRGPLLRPFDVSLDHACREDSPRSSLDGSHATTARGLRRGEDHAGVGRGPALPGIEVRAPGPTQERDLAGAGDLTASLVRPAPRRQACESLEQAPPLPRLEGDRAAARRRGADAHRDRAPPEGPQGSDPSGPRRSRPAPQAGTEERARAASPQDLDEPLALLRESRRREVPLPRRTGQEGLRRVEELRGVSSLGALVGVHLGALLVTPPRHASLLAAERDLGVSVGGRQERGASADSLSAAVDVRGIRGAEGPDGMVSRSSVQGDSDLASLALAERLGSRGRHLHPASQQGQRRCADPHHRGFRNEEGPDRLVSRSAMQGHRRHAAVPSQGRHSSGNSDRDTPLPAPPPRALACINVLGIGRDEGSCTPHAKLDAKRLTLGNVTLVPVAP